MFITIKQKRKGLQEETYRHSDPLNITKIPTKFISIFPFVYIINLLIQDPAKNQLSKGPFYPCV